MEDAPRIPYLSKARCVGCGAGYPIEGLLYDCPLCGGNLDLLYDYGAIAERLERHGRDELNPALLLAPVRVEKGDRLYFEIAASKRSVPAERTAADLGLRSLTLIDDTTLPSGSFKDRASIAVLMRARELGLRTVAGASTGNAGASLACLAARLGMEAVIFAPRAAPAAKLRQIQAHGARLILVDGNYDAAFDLCLEAIAERGWYSRNTAHNPWCAEGKKSVSLSLAGSGDTLDCDVILVPAGDGCILAGVHKGLVDLQRIGWIRELPRLIAVQATGSAAIANAWRAGGTINPVPANTVADSLAVDLPRDGAKALRAIRETNGVALTVDDDEILKAVVDLATREGIFAEPAGAAVIAGLRRAIEEGSVDPGERVVALVTGNGLKDRDAIAPIVGEAPVISNLAELP